MTRKKRKWKEIIIGVVAIIAIALIAFRIYLPYCVKDYVNQVLNDIKGYHGSVEDVDIHLYRGAYSFQNLNLYKTGAGQKLPFIHIDDTDLSIQWAALFKGRIVSDAYLTNANLNFIINDDKAVQTGEEADWTKTIKDLSPIDINFVKVNSGKISYIDYSASPNVNLYINNLNGEVTNLRNVDDENVPLPSDITISGGSIGEGKLNLTGKLNILKVKPNMDLNLKLEDADLTAINTYAKEHAALDFSRGNLSIYSEVAIKDGQIVGYIKPLATNIRVVDLKQDEGVLEILWESIASIILEIFENQQKDQFASKIPLEGNLDDIKRNNWEAFISILRNAFIKAFTPDIDGNISLLKGEESSENEKNNKDKKDKTDNSEPTGTTTEEYLSPDLN